MRNSAVCVLLLLNLSLPAGALRKSNVAGPADDIIQAASGLLLDVKSEASHLKALAQDIAPLVPRLQSGGAKAEAAAARLLALSSQPNAKIVMKFSGVQFAALLLMKRPTSSARLQRLAGSLVTQLTGYPVVSSLSDKDTGSYGRMNIVLPRPSRVSVFALLRVLVACSRALQGTRQTTPCCNCSRVSAPLPLSNQCQRTGAALLPKPQEKPNFACDSAQILHGLPCASRLLR
ncbi:unnamed protein product [Effrenium voratum]|nr:unnamed protein product [Effrenium voratum]